jgi:hypothetical protein
MLIVQRRRLLLYPSYVQDYLDRVTAADVAAGNTQGLELGVTDAFNTTLQDLVGDSVLGVSGGVIAQPASIIKASCILAGARTLAGALVPLVGAAPTRFGTEGGWNYNRKTGTAGNGTDNYLNSNRNNNADPQNSNHNAFYVSNVGVGPLMTGGPASSAGDNYFDFGGGIHRFTNRHAIVVNGAVASIGFKGTSRNAGASYELRINLTTITQSIVSQPPSAFSVELFSRPSATRVYGNARLAFYSIGEALNLALLDARVTALINAIAAAIP